MAFGRLWRVGYSISVLPEAEWVPKESSFEAP
jgi:hypothetical protein